MQSRFVKQLIFGGLYISVLAAVFLIGYFVFRPAGTCFDNRRNQVETGVDCGGSCVDCAIKNVVQISIFQPPQLVAANAKTSGIFLQFTNSNQAVAAEQFFYDLIFFNAAGEKIHSLTNEGFIYAGQIKSVVISSVKVASEDVIRIEARAYNPVWKLAAELAMPIIQVRAVRTELDKDRGRIAGRVLNSGNSDLSRVEIGAVLYDSRGQLSALSSTVINDLRAFEERAFSIFFSTGGKAINPNATQVFADAKR